MQEKQRLAETRKQTTKDEHLADLRKFSQEFKVCALSASTMRSEQSLLYTTCSHLSSCPQRRPRIARCSPLQTQPLQSATPPGWLVGTHHPASRDPSP